MERLQHCLYKSDGTLLNDPQTWNATAQELAALSQSLWHLEQVRQHWPIVEVE
jgi:hypothetical protein